jgi:hypothetical protein
LPHNNKREKSEEEDETGEGEYLKKVWRLSNLLDNPIPGG